MRKLPSLSNFTRELKLKSNCNSSGENFAPGYETTTIQTSTVNCKHILVILNFSIRTEAANNGRQLRGVDGVVPEALVEQRLDEVALVLRVAGNL